MKVRNTSPAPDTGRQRFDIRGIAQPDGHRHLRRDAAERDVLVLGGRARLRSHHLAVRQRRLLARALGRVDDGLHDLGGRMGDLGRDDLLAMRLGKRGIGRGVVDDHLALRVGDGEDGRIKSALGIGALLADGLGDTIRVSLSEAPEAEIPVARKLVDYIMQHQDHPYIPGAEAEDFNYLSPVRRETTAVRNIGGEHLPVVIAERMDGKFDTNPQFIPDYIYAGRALPETREEGVEYILDADVWKEEPGTYPAFNYQQMPLMGNCQADLKFMFMPYMAQTEEVIACLKHHPEVVIISQSNHPNRLGEHRALVHQLMQEGLKNPVVFFQHYAENEAEDLQIKSAADMGALIFDGLCDGIFLFNQGNLSHALVDATAFGILQAGRIRTSKTEYISCPGCGRTLFDLQSTIARIKAATSHLKGLKIGIMGCIVNGPGEMADADYGYVGAGRGKISLYKKKECIEKNIPEEEAVEKLIELIKANGDYEEK